MSQQVSLLPGHAAIRKHLEFLKTERRHPQLRYDYDTGVRDALLWVLNGGEPPATTGTIPYLKQRCRECGCTENACHNCIKRVGVPCHWVESDLCSACAEVES